MKSELLRARPGMWGLFGKYVVSFVGLVVFVLAVNGALEIYITYRDTTTTVTAQQTQRAEAISDRIDQFISEMERQISWATRASSATVEQHRADYVLLLQQVTPIEELAHIGGDGREQLRVTHIGDEHPGARDHERDRGVIPVGAPQQIIGDVQLVHRERVQHPHHVHPVHGFDRGGRGGHRFPRNTPPSSSMPSLMLASR